VKAWLPGLNFGREFAYSGDIRVVAFVVNATEQASRLTEHSYGRMDLLTMFETMASDFREQ